MPLRHQQRQALRLRCTAQAVRTLFTGAITLSLLTTSGAQVMKLADAPVGNGLPSDVVYPNIAMVIDDSGSMAFPNMPNDLNVGVYAQLNGEMEGKRCYGFTGYNRLAYDPTITYTPPYDPAESTKQKPNASFTSARYDGYRAKYTTSNRIKAYDDESNLEYDLSPSTTNPKVPTIKLGAWPNSYGNKRVIVKFYYSKLKSNSADPSICNADTDYTPVTDSGDIEAPGVNKGSAAALTNYANWYSYYRTRGYIMKVAAGNAFSSLSNKYRVGLFFLNGNTTQAIDDFTSAKQLTWYSELYSSRADGSTPLRSTLANIGRMYAGEGPHSAIDPVQYSCQQNFTILSSDGAWNGTSTPKKLGGSSDIGDQDGSETAPERKDTYAAQNTLADTALYYYKTDLRTSNCSKTTGGATVDVCENNVRGSGNDLAAHQHMTTFTIGLGVDGEMNYESDYENAPDDPNKQKQYYDIRAGVAGAVWPNPTDDIKKIDDLWHAAVNGRGTYFSAKDPASLSDGIEKALGRIKERRGSGTAAATASLELVAGNNAIYVAQYRTVEWDGNLIARNINGTTGVIDTTEAWNANAQLEDQVKTAKNGDGRSIKYFKSTSQNNLDDFFYSNLTTGEKAYFQGKVCPTSAACPHLSTSTLQSAANNGENLVNYLRGQRTYEIGTNSTDPLYRERKNLLGDIVNATPVFVQKPQFNYDKFDTTYGTFKSNKDGRAGTIYAAANDGMLHAIASDTGNERWAYVPSFVMPNMWQLAKNPYEHRYFVDGAPTVADVCSARNTTTPTSCAAANDWKTILVGGLGKGGCGYYALDVTDPANPKGLWEFTHNQMGYSYGQPVITRKKDGRWVAIFTSGYNNVPGTDGACGKTTGDGKGYVFVVDALDGTLLDTISTGEGSTSTPSNLGRLNAWVEVAELNTADSLYAGDMLGNVWRIDFDDNIAPAGKEAFKLATLRNAAGTAQPISVKPELAFTNGHRLVMVGTGRTLHADDVKDTQLQSVYALKDDLSTTPLGNPRANTDVKARTLVEGTGANSQIIRTVTGSNINWGTDKGWYFDFLAAGANRGAERVNVDMQLQYNILTVAANVPGASICTADGYGWLYYVDLETGKHVTTATDAAIGTRLASNTMTSGIKIVKLADGRTVTIVSDTLGDVRTVSAPSPTGAAAGGARRTMWREIPD